MPIYEYQCAACGHRMEAIQKVSDEPLRKCPECGKDKLEKLVSAASFHLKGSGWYVTDFKDKPKTKAEPKAESNQAAAPVKESTSTKKEDKS